MKILVTGGAGFIGSNFIRYVLERYRDYRVVNLDKLTYAGNLENLAGLEKESRYEFVRGDICDEELVRGVLAKGIDAVIHFAAETHVDRSILDASEFIRTNVAGTFNLLENCRRAATERFIQISTDEVYGSLGASGRFSEDSPLVPNNPYAASKASADLLVRSYCRTHDFPGIILRCCNNYGPYQFPEKFIPLMICNALADAPLPIYGDGMQVRDWIHVRDHCSAIDAALHHGRSGEVYNVGARQELSNLEVAHRILNRLGKSTSLITHVEDRLGHDRRYAIDPSKMEKELKWHATTTLDDGLQETIEWYRCHASWLEHVRTGVYAAYYELMYKSRSGLRS